jgi:hypothetical protein
MPDLTPLYQLNICNANETGLFYNLLLPPPPKKPSAWKGNSIMVVKGKEYPTVFLHCNSNGSEKFTCLATGKYAEPRCYKNMFSL